MSTLRERAPAAVLRRGIKCSDCGARILTIEPFCGYCGRANSAFEVRAFERVAKCSLVEAQNNCKEDENHQVERWAHETYLLEHPRAERFRFCSVCGVPLEWSPER